MGTHQNGYPAHGPFSAAARRTTMDLDAIVKKARELSKPFRVTKGEKFRLKDVDPRDTLGLK